MQSATLKAPAKVNLYLEIKSRRPDGYHELLTLFHHLREPCDILEIEPLKPGRGLVLDCSIPGLRDQDNLIFKAWNGFAQATGFGPDMRVRLVKNIPTGAGLGGGSTDAAAILRFLNGQAGDRALDSGRLNALAASLGADVPFFLMDGPAWATGIGEKLTPADVNLAGLTLLLVCPDVHVSSARAYSDWDKRYANHPETKAAKGFLTSTGSDNNNPFPNSQLVLFNDFESTVFDAHSELRKIKEKFLLLGACGAVMSGSGSSVFGLFREETTARGAAMEFAPWARTFVQAF